VLISVFTIRRSAFSRTLVGTGVFIVIEQYREREDKFDVDTDWSVPDLTAVIPAMARIEQREVSLSSRYFDTPGRDLLGHGVTLRLRSGDTDTGWQLKVPDGLARKELRVPADGDARAVPALLREVVFGLAGGGGLRPVATLDTTRIISRIVDPGDRLLAEIDDDQVSATRTGADTKTTPRLKKARRGKATDELLHRARKASKRTRYTAELASPVLRKTARRAVKRATALQDVFGEHQDSIIASEHLLQLGTSTDAAAAGNAFAYGVLYAHEQQRRCATREEARTFRWA
jgi:inorganic triphosphatase YgiF